MSTRMTDIRSRLITPLDECILTAVSRDMHS